MDKEGIIKKMRSGWALRNRGSAWYLIAPLTAYETKTAILVKDKIVDELGKKGIIKVSIPYKTIIAELVTTDKKRINF